MNKLQPTKVLRRLRFSQDSTAVVLTAVALLCWETIISGLIVWKFPYTEIDWTTYMQQVEGFLQGERDYSKLGGNTGPLVYPAGFLYVYTALYWLTGHGKIFAGQCAFLVIYVASQAVVMGLYVKSKAVPAWALILLCLSKRLHSIYLLRLFNDCIAMLLAYGAIWLLTCRRWRLSLLGFSAAVSVKMNVLLMAPGVLIVLMKAAPVRDVVEGVLMGAGLQLLLGAPFLLCSPQAYMHRSFDFSRVFLHRWTVNLKFLPEETFQSKTVAASLLSLHLVLLVFFFQRRWCRREGGFLTLAHAFCNPSHQKAAKEGAPLRTDQMLNITFTANFVGVICARSLHYQFYSWYFHTLPFLLWQVEVHSIVRCGVFLIIEVIWNVYPPTPASSAWLTACHVCILFALQNQKQSHKPHHAKPHLRARISKEA